MFYDINDFEYTDINQNIRKAVIIENQAESNQIEEESLTVASHFCLSNNCLASVYRNDSPA